MRSLPRCHRRAEGEALTTKEILDDAGLTEKQEAMWRARAAGVGVRTIARSFGVSPQTVRDHLEAADLKIERAKEAAA